MNFSEKKYVNKTAILGHTIIDTVLFLAYLMEVFKGSRTIGYFAVFAAMAVAPVAAEWLIFGRNPESGAIKHIIAITYGILYLFVIFTTTSILPFTYVFPMFTVIILYMDVRYNVIISIFALVGNIAYVIYHAVTIGYTSLEIPDVEIRLAAVLLTSVFMVIATVGATKVNNQKLMQIQNKTNETKRLTDHVLSTSQEMAHNITEITEQMNDLGDSVEKVHDAMGEVSTGSAETAQSIQIQMQRTEQIQEHIGKVKSTAVQIGQNVSDTAQKVKNGSAQMEALAEQVEKSKSANAEVLEKMEELSTYTSQMNTIIEAINSIADNTGLLALNASIEAARAGESGKGFAVVASQISELANQTQTATSNITTLIQNINKELKHVEDAVDVVTKSNDANAESTDMVKSHFTGISRGTEDINNQTKELLYIVGNLERANEDIVENIQTISAITEEISAHASETYHVCDENTQMVDSVRRIVNDLNESTQKIRMNQ